jgi:hypothetical protein
MSLNYDTCCPAVMSETMFLLDCTRDNLHPAEYAACSDEEWLSVLIEIPWHAMTLHQTRFESLVTYDLDS